MLPGCPLDVRRMFIVRMMLLYGGCSMFDARCSALGGVSMVVGLSTIDIGPFFGFELAVDFSTFDARRMFAVQSIMPAT